MKGKGVRVLVASESPQIRYFIQKNIIEREPGTTIVAQAENASKALTLTKRLRPDVAIIDFSIPYVASYGNNQLSRISGLDAAQNISSETPNTQVVLLCNLDTALPAEHRLTSNTTVMLLRKSDGTIIPFTIRELFNEVAPAEALVFANVEIKQAPPLKQEGISLSDKTMLFGGVALFAGWFLILTMFLAPVGVFLAIAGGLLMSLSLLNKKASAWWHKLRHGATEK